MTTRRAPHRSASTPHISDPVPYATHIHSATAEMAARPQAIDSCMGLRNTASENSAPTPKPTMTTAATTMIQRDAWSRCVVERMSDKSAWDAGGDELICFLSCLTGH